MFKKIFMERKMQELIITLKIERQSPLNLQILSNAVLSLNASLGKFIEQDKGISKFELQLKGVEKGSDIFHFFVNIYSVLPFNEYLNAINAYFELWKNLKSIKQQNIEAIQNERYINKTMAKDMLNIINLHSIGANANITNNFNNNQITINHNNFKLYCENLDFLAKIKGFNEKIEIKTLYENMIIEFYQTTNTQKALKHKAFCFNLSREAKDIFIDDEVLKKEMLDNPYKYKFLVDLEVYQGSEGKITTYRAFNYKDKIIKEF